jgi:2-iminobutanoate/2-iminopropanoate deaminase
MKKQFLFLFSILIVSSCATPSKNTAIRYVTVSGIPKSTSPISSAVWAGDYCYLSGQLGTDPTTGQMPEAFADEANGIMKNIERILQSTGLDFSNVVKSTVYLTDMKDFPAMNEIYKSYFKNGQYPARETVQVLGLARGARVEISVVAYKER